MEAYALTRRAALSTLAAVLADPTQTRAAAATLEPVSLTTPSGRTVNAALARPAAAKAPGLVVIHEFWGLNDQIKAYTRDLADQGYLALAVDLMGVPPTSDPDRAMQQMQAVKPAEAAETLAAWAAW